MKQNRNNQILIIIIFTVQVAMFSCKSNSGSSVKEVGKTETSTYVTTEYLYKVTFIELGSVKCIPCQQMQPVMKSIEAKYGKEVKVDFHDVWTDAGKPFAIKYGIEAIPTQIFLDESGKEYFRHVGFFAEEDLIKVLQQKGVKLN
jgi:thioredoxin 1